MRKRPMLMLAGVFLLGIFWYEQRTWPFLAAFVLIEIYEGWGLWKKKQWKRWAARSLVFLAVFGISFFHIKSLSLCRERYLGQISDGEFRSVQGEISKKQTKKDLHIYYLKNCYTVLSGESLACGSVTACFSSDEYSIGQTLVIYGQVNMFEEATNEGMFDAREYYRSQGIAFCMYSPEVRGAYGGENRIAEGLYRIREGLADTLSLLLDGEEAGVLAGMLLGDRSRLEDGIKEAYQSAGISHVLAVSGLHISVFAMGCYRLLRKRRRGFFGSALAAGAFAVMYTQFTGAGISTQRAAVMFLLSVFAAVAGLTYDMLNALGICVIWLLWENPFLCGYAGFVFSVMAVLGIGLTVQAFLEEAPGKLRKAVLGGFGLQITTLPVTAYYYYELPSYAILVNLAVLPLLPLVLGSGASGAILGRFWLPAGKLCIIPANYVLKGYHALCELAGKLPFSQVIVGKPSAGKLLIYYLLLCGMIYLRRKRKENPQIQKDKKRRGTDPVLWIGAAVLLALLYHRASVGPEIDMLDVGQGDGIFFADGGGTSFFIDGGSTSVGNVGKYRILPFLKAKGIPRIDYWFISHADADHISGVEEVLESGYPVNYLVLAKAIPRDEAYERLAEAAQENGVQILYLAAGDRMETEKAAVRCLYPEYGEGPEGVSAGSADRNERCLVLLLETAEFSCLFPGDITAAQEKQLLESGALQRVDIYKAAHHGSNYSNTLEYLETLFPQAALVSCGSANSYGHPGEEAVANLKAAGAEVYFTMTQGQISVVPGENGIEVRPFLK